MFCYYYYIYSVKHHEKQHLSYIFYYKINIKVVLSLLLLLSSASLCLNQARNNKFPASSNLSVHTENENALQQGAIIANQSIVNV